MKTVKERLESKLTQKDRTILNNLDILLDNQGDKREIIIQQKDQFSNDLIQFPI